MLPADKGALCSKDVVRFHFAALLEQKPSESTKIVKNPAGSTYMEFELVYAV